MKLSKELIDDHLTNELVNETLWDSSDRSQWNEKEERVILEEGEEEEEEEEEEVNASHALPQEDKLYLDLQSSNQTGSLDRVTLTPITSSSTTTTTTSLPPSLSSSPTSVTTPLPTTTMSSTLSPIFPSVFFSRFSSTSETPLLREVPTSATNDTLIPGRRKEAASSQQQEEEGQEEEFRSSNTIFRASSQDTKVSDTRQKRPYNSSSLKLVHAAEVVVVPTINPTPQSLVRHSATPARIAVCSANSCGRWSSCHLNENSATGFDCVCPDGTRVTPGLECNSAERVDISILNSSSSSSSPPSRQKGSRNGSISKRKTLDRGQRSRTPPKPKAHEPQSLTRLSSTAAPSPYKVCDSDPCGESSCHPNIDGVSFECVCTNGERVEPHAVCPSTTVDITPPVQGIPERFKPQDHYNRPGWFPPIKPQSLLGVFLTVFVVLMAMLVMTYWRRKTLIAFLRHRHRDKKSESSPNSPAKSSSLLINNFASNPNYYAQAPDNLPLQSLAVQFIDKEQISFVGELGEGCFGKVYKGEYGPRCPENLLANENGGSSPRVSTTVAVKVLKDCAGVEAEADFLREVEIMSAFRHENILTLVGIVASESVGTPWMVFEYMPYGDLAEVLRSCNKPFYVNDPPVKSLGKEDLLNMSIQIASGMEYLSSQHFVHRDLACRNCLVGENLCIKISDFGMSRDVYTCDYYKVGGTRMLPVRWMAPESIMYGKFTLESDVWSFGVVLWEIYSYGKQPYYGNNNENVVNLILQGILLGPPSTCSAQVCDVMRKCWSTEPHDRIKFPDIMTSLTRILHGNPDGYLPDTPTTPGPSITYSELCMEEESDVRLSLQSEEHLQQGSQEEQLDVDEYLVPKKVEHREYLTVLSEV